MFAVLLSLIEIAVQSGCKCHGYDQCVDSYFYFTFIDSN